MYVQLRPVLGVSRGSLPLCELVVPRLGLSCLPPSGPWPWLLEPRVRARLGRRHL